MKTVLSSFVLGSFLSIVAVGCTSAQQQAAGAAIPPVAACIVDVLMATTGATEDPATIATSCSAAVTDVLAVVEALLSNQPKAVVVSPDGSVPAVAPSGSASAAPSASSTVVVSPAPVLADAQRAKLERVRAAAKAFTATH